MATRFRLTSSTTAPDVSPALQSYTHTQTSRRKLITASDGSALTNSAYNPDAADHHVAGDAHHIQFVSDPMAAGNVFTSGDTLKAVIQAFEPNSGNNLVLQLFVSVVSQDGGTVQATLRSKAGDDTELFVAVGTPESRNVQTTLSASYTTVAGDRLVVEISATGTPTAASGTNAHNSTIRWGCNGAGGDLAENDTEQGTTFNPWIEFLTTITFMTDDLATKLIQLGGASNLTPGMLQISGG